MRNPFKLRRDKAPVDLRGRGSAPTGPTSQPDEPLDEVCNKLEIALHRGVDAFGYGEAPTRERRGLAATLEKLETGGLSVPPSSLSRKARESRAVMALLKGTPNARLAGPEQQQMAERVLAELAGAAGRQVLLPNQPTVAVLEEGAENLLDNAAELSGTGAIRVGSLLFNVAQYIGGSAAEASSPAELLTRVHAPLSGDVSSSRTPEANRGADAVIRFVLGHELSHFMRDDWARMSVYSDESFSALVSGSGHVERLQADRRRRHAQETAADLIGMDLALETNGSPLALSFFVFHAMTERMLGSTPTDHPSSESRYERLYHHVEQWLIAHPEAERVRADFQKLPTPQMLFTYLADHFPSAPPPPDEALAMARFNDEQEARLKSSPDA